MQMVIFFFSITFNPEPMKNKLSAILICFGSLLAAQSPEKWEAMGTSNDEVSALHVYKGKLYAGGRFTTADGQAVDRFAVYDTLYLGQAWKWQWFGLFDLGNVNTIATFDDRMYAGGGFLQVNSSNAFFIASNGGSSWTAVGSGVNSNIYSLAAYDNALYAAGAFTSAGNIPAKHIARWDGTAWSIVGGNLQGSNNQNARQVFAWNGALYVCGSFTSAGGVPTQGVAKWDGSTWSALADFGVYGSLAINASIHLAEYAGELYASGNYTVINGQPLNYMAKYNGTSWTAVTNGLALISGIRLLGTFNGELYATGICTVAGSPTNNNIVKWDGSSWRLAATLDGSAPIVRCMTEYNGSAVFGGLFNGVNGDASIKNFARYTPANPVGLKSQVTGKPELFPNPVNEKLTVRPGPGEVRLSIMNCSGVTVYDSQIAKETHVDVGSWTKGLYIVTFGDKRIKLVVD